MALYGIQVMEDHRVALSGIDPFSTLFRKAHCIALQLEDRQTPLKGIK